jgi:aminopeptidase N
VTSVAVGGRASRARAVNGHLVIPANEISAGENVVDISFRAGDAALNRNPDFLYTLFVPARAHLTFPCFDQPDLKARYSLTLTVPADWQSVANGAETAREPAGGRMRIRYAETQPIPTYLFAFAAGRFAVETAERRGRTFHMLHRETDAAKVARNRDAIFDLHASALAWLEEYTGIPYQFGKFDFVLVPSFQFSGMEHPGAILYNAASMLLDESATENQILNRASTISHETAHMWFGDLVTMRWFDDVWMKEVFANFMAGKIVNPSFPNVNHELRFLAANYPSAYGVDRTEGTHPIRQPLDNLRDAGSQYGAIIYQKAPIVMRQLERLIGEEQMRDGLRTYLDRFRFGNATWLDLVRVLDDRTERDLSAWSRAWVEEGGRPTIATALEMGADGRIADLSFTQSDGRDDRRLQWTEKMQVIIDAGGRQRTLPLELDGPRVDVPDARGLANVRFVLPTGGGLGYGDFVLDAASRRYLLAHVADLTDPLTRGAVWITLWEELLDRRVTPSAFVSALLGALPREDVQQNAQILVGCLREAYWRFSRPADRERLAPEVERAMRSGLARAKTASEKAIYFNGFRSMALTPEGVAYLERVWSRAEKIPGLPLAEPDEATMALELAVRGVANAAAILDAQRARFTNPDRKARFEFVMPAVSASAETRRTFFAGLADAANRRREPWVIEGLSYLNHPLRMPESAGFVRPSLERLEDVQKTGDIFFPKNWMDATLGGCQSRDVADTVRAFLAARPDYPIRLRRIILQSADDLFRAADVLEPRQ